MAKPKYIRKMKHNYFYEFKLNKYYQEKTEKNIPNIKKMLLGSHKVFLQLFDIY